MGRGGGKIKPGGVRAGGEKKGEGFPLPPEFRRPGSSFVPLGVLACGLNVVGGERTRPGTAPPAGVTRPGDWMAQLHPLVPPQVLHFMQVPLRTNV